MVFRGREFMLREQAHAVLDKVVELTKDFAQVEQPAKFEGRVITMLLGPK